MDTEGSNERDVTMRILVNDNEGGGAVDDTEMDAPEEFSASYRDVAAAISAEVVEDRDLQREVQERLDNITIDAMLVVNVSSNEEEHSKARSDSIRKTTAITRIVAAALILLAIVSGTIIGTRTRRPEPLATMVTSSPTTSISVLEFAISILAPLSGEEALMDESSPQYKSLWWMAHEDPANMMMSMMVDNETQSSSSSSMSTEILERYTMALLYFSTDGPNWVSSYDFLSNESTCDWGEPIRCSEEKTAVEIGLGKSSLLQMALLVAPFSCKHSPTHQNVFTPLFLSFSILRVEENNLNGSLPSELYALSSLQALSMWGNSLQGTLSTHLGRLTRLTSLQLGENLLTGSFPESFSNLRKLEWLYMDYNALTGIVPILPSLEVMGIASNFLTGTISESSSSYLNLRIIVWDWNMISGSIPESLFLSSKLEVVALWSNQLSGSLSSKLANLVQVEWLDLSTNDMTGSIPSEIGLLKNLELLHLDSNAFNGTIASQFGSMTRLEQLRLQENQLSGSVPMELSSLLSAKSIKLFANNLTGSLDDVFCQQPSVVLSKVDADCGGADPQVECTCCTTCCDSSSGNCTTSEEAVCLVEKSWHEDPNGRAYHESAGTICECITTGTEDNPTAALSCRDTECQSCNRDGTVCSMNEYYQYSYGEDTNWDKITSTFQYVVGRNDTVVLETTRQPDALLTCKVTVNGQVCNSCFTAYCKDWFHSVHVNCENVKGAGNLNLCDASGTNDDGPLAVFAFQDLAYLQGCPPRIFVE
jgi:hypothetical protein